MNAREEARERLIEVMEAAENAYMFGHYDPEARDLYDAVLDALRGFLPVK